MPKGKRKPPLIWVEEVRGRIYALQIASGLRIVVTRHKDEPPDLWLLCVYGQYLPLVAKEITEAQKEALQVLRARLTAQLRDLAE